MYDTIGNVKVSYDFYKESDKREMSEAEKTKISRNSSSGKRTHIICIISQM